MAISVLVLNCINFAGYQSGRLSRLAMLDALDLSECLTNAAFNNLQEAIDAYEKNMFERSINLCQETVAGIADFAAPGNESIQELISMFTEKK